MAFTVQDFQDLLRLLEQHPEWQAELRRRVLTDELLEVPLLLRRMAEAQARTDENIASITQRLDTLAARVDAMAAAQARTDEHIVALTERLDRLTERVDALTLRLDALTARVDVLTTRVDANTGELLEMRYERRGPAYFAGLARRLRVLDRSTLADLLDEGVDQGRIVEAERRDVLFADLVLAGQRREDRADVYLVVEVSAGIGVDDVRRAADRAEAMSKLGRPVIPVVAGQRMDPEPAALASALGVRQVLDGHTTSPGEAGS